MMKRFYTFFFIFLLGVGFSQTNDDLRTGANKKKNSKNSRNSTYSSSSNSTLSNQDISLLLDVIGLAYNLGALSSGIVVAGIQRNTDFIQERKDSFPRIKNLEANLGYGFYPDNYASYTPKVRFQAGVFGTSVRAFIRQDKNNTFLTDLWAVYSWQFLELNYLNRKHITIRSGMGVVLNNTDQGNVSSAEFTTGADFFLLDERLRINIESRATPFGEMKFRKEANARVYLRPSPDNKFKLELFAGGYYAQYFDEVNIWSAEAGVGFMLY